MSVDGYLWSRRISVSEGRIYVQQGAEPKVMCHLDQFLSTTGKVLSINLRDMTAFVDFGGTWGATVPLAKIEVVDD